MQKGLKKLKNITLVITVFGDYTENSIASKSFPSSYCHLSTILVSHFLIPENL